MAFKNAAFNRTADRGDANKAAGFINLYLPTEGGGKRKLGMTGIALRVSKEDEARLAEWLTNEANFDKFKQKLIVEFNLNQPKEGSGFALD